MTTARTRGPAEERVGAESVRLARHTLEEVVGGRRKMVTPNPAAGAGLGPAFDERRGVFVTLTHHPSGDLRGCVGFPLPVLPLREAIPRATYAAAREDPRFPPVGPGELERLVVEVSLLTVPERVTAPTRDRLPEAIVVGRDGLIVEGFGASGLLLPQVAPDQGWNARQLLAGTCEKAGLPADAWLSPEVEVQRFGSLVYRERSPRGPVEAREL